MTHHGLGQRRDRNRLQQLQGKFRLREGLSAAGAIPIAAAIDCAKQEIRRQADTGTFRSDSADQYAFLLNAFSSWCVARGVVTLGEVNRNHVYAWLRTPSASRPEERPATNTMLARRSALNALFTTCTLLGLWDVNPAAGVALPARPERAFNPFTSDQIDWLKDHSAQRVDDRLTPVALAVLISGSQLGESGWITARDVDMAGRRVWVPEGSHWGTGRWLLIADGWAWERIRNRANHLITCNRIEAPLAYEGASSSRTARSAAITMRIKNLLKASPFRPENHYTVGSITDWVAVHEWENTKSIERVAARLGLSRLDDAADRVGYDWRAIFCDSEPPPHRQDQS